MNIFSELEAGNWGNALLLLQPELATRLQDDGVKLDTPYRRLDYDTMPRCSAFLSPGAGRQYFAVPSYGDAAHGYIIIFRWAADGFRCDIAGLSYNPMNCSRREGSCPHQQHTETCEEWDGYDSEYDCDECAEANECECDHCSTDTDLCVAHGIIHPYTF